MKFAKIFLTIAIATAIGALFSACDSVTDSDEAPVIDRVEPTSGTPGTLVTIYGSEFGDYDMTGSKVYFGDVEATEFHYEGNEIYWYEDEIKVYVPEEASTGNIYAEVNGTKSNGVIFEVIKPDPITELKATSIDNSTVALHWALSISEGDENFIGYELVVAPQEGDIWEPIVIQSGTNHYEVDNLTQGDTYTFTIYAIMTMGQEEVPSEGAEIQWSPASRFTEPENDIEIYMYESTSSLGSGLDLCNDDGYPETLTVGGGEEWDIGLYTFDGSVTVGSAAQILAEYSSFDGTAKSVEIGDAYFDAASLDDVMLSEGLDQEFEFAERTFDLSQLDVNNNVVFVLRTNYPEWNYAKVMIKQIGGSFIQGSGDNQYLVCEVSYQKGKGVPYAF